MISDEQIIQWLAYNEGVRTEPYKCTQGKLTIGVGRNLEDNPLTPEELKQIGHDPREGITKDQAFYLLRNDIKKVKRQLDGALPWWRDLDGDRPFVLLDMCFQMGLKSLLGFKNTLHYIATGCYLKAADNLLKSLYAKQTPKRAERNAQCLREGKYLI